jgi:hypothetical protein
VVRSSDRHLSLTLLTETSHVVLLNIPAIFIAFKHYNVLHLFLIADLFCTATVGPMLLGAWKKTTSFAALMGCATGLLTIFGYGWYVTGSVVGGFEWFILPHGMYSTTSMIIFILALIVPTLTTWGITLIHPTSKSSDYIYRSRGSSSPIERQLTDQTLRVGLQWPRFLIFLNKLDQCTWLFLKQY